MLFCAEIAVMELVNEALLSQSTPVQPIGSQGLDLMIRCSYLKLIIILLWLVGSLQVYSPPKDTISEYLLLAAVFWPICFHLSQTKEPSEAFGFDSLVVYAPGGKTPVAGAPWAKWDHDDHQPTILRRSAYFDVSWQLKGAAHFWQLTAVSRWSCKKLRWLCHVALDKVGSGMGWESLRIWQSLSVDDPIEASWSLATQAGDFFDFLHLRFLVYWL